MKVRIISMLTIKGLFLNWKQIILMYVIFPLSICFVTGHYSKMLYAADENKIDITIIDKDNGNAAQDFRKFFNREDNKKLFNVTKKGDYIITLKRGNSKSPIEVQVQEKRHVSEHNEKLIKSVIESYGEELKNKENFNYEIIRDEIIKNKNEMSIYEEEAASIVTYIIIIIIMNCSKAYDLEKQNGMFKRMISMPLTKINLFNYYVLIYFIYGIGTGIIYVLAFMIAKLAFFNVNFINLIVILLAQSLMIASASGFFSVFFKKNLSTVILTTLLLIETLLGGGFIPKVKSDAVLTSLVKFEPLKFVSDAYKDIIMYNSLSYIERNLIIMFFVSLALYIISLAKIKISWEE